jgi:uncharacterized membrane protein (DUF4010 family)
MFGLSLMSVFVFPKKYRKTQNLEKIEIDHPFAMKPALRFAFFFFLVTLISKIALVFVGSGGLYLTGILSGFVDVDAITLSMATLSGSGEVSFKIASTTILLALISNTLVKSGMAYLFGNKKVGRILFLISFIVLSLGAGLFWIF